MTFIHSMAYSSSQASVQDSSASDTDLGVITISDFILLYILIFVIRCRDRCATEPPSGDENRYVEPGGSKQSTPSGEQFLFLLFYLLMMKPYPSTSCATNSLKPLPRNNALDAVR